MPFFTLIDYEVIVFIRKGSTFIKLTEDSPTAHLFGIRKTTTKTLYLNNKSEDYHRIEGAIFRFNIKSGLREISSKGPIDNDVEFVVSIIS